MKRLTRKQINEFNKEVVEILEFYGATENNDPMFSNYSFVMESDKIGKLFIKIDTDISPIYTIFTRFNEYEKAKKYFNLGLNPKNNCHTYSKEQALCFIDGLLDNYCQINGIDKHAEYLAQ